MSNIRHRRALSVAALAALALTAAACGSSSTSSAATAAPTTTAGGSGSTTTVGGSTTTAAATSLPSKITIGYQQVPNGDLIVKHDKLLESAFGPSVKIDWKLFDSGGAVNEAVAAGAVDIGLVGSSPTSRGISTGIPYEVPWIFDVIGKAEALVVKGDKGINSIADLKGKTIATPFASTSHYSLLAALQEAGLSDKDVKVIDSAPDAIFAAWKAGQIDGAYVWNPNLAKLVSDNGKVLITSEDLAKKGKTTYDLAIVTTKFAQQYPGAVQTWLDQQNAAVKEIRSDPAKAADSVAAELNISAADAKDQLSQLIFLDASQQVGTDYLGGGLADNLYAAAVFNKNLGKIDSVKDKSAYQAAIVTTFAAAAK
jgi:taurine transport system substrate-binding protein